MQAEGAEQVHLLDINLSSKLNDVRDTSSHFNDWAIS